MRKILPVITLLLGFGLASHAQTLLYQWNFTNSDGILGTPTNMPPLYTAPALAGTGNLFVKNSVGTTGAGVNCYFTNGAGVGPGSGPGGSAAGAYNIASQGYNGGGPACTVLGTNLNLGTMYKVTVTFWFQFGTSVSGQFPRLVQVSPNSTYDNGGANGLGSSVNGWSTGVTGVAQQLQNAVGGTAGSDSSGATTANLPASFFDSVSGKTGVTTANNQWYFEAIEYDATLPSNNYKVWLGTTTTNVVLVGSRTAAYGGIAFGTNATIQMGNRNSNGSRGITSGGIADVRIYAGTCSSNNLEAIRTFSTGFVDDGSGTASAPVVAVPPSSGTSHVGQSRTFTVSVTGLTPLTYLWKSNGVAIAGATSASLTLTNIPLSANGANYSCSVTNAVGGTNSAAATLTVIAATPGSYAAAALAQSPYVYYHLNETTNGVSDPTLPVTISDYINGLDGTAVYPTNTSFNVADLSSPAFPGFSATNTAIEIYNVARGSLLNMAAISTFTNGMTMCGWIKTFGVPNSRAIIYSQNPNDGSGASTTGAGYGLKFAGPATDVNGNAGALLSYNWNYTAVSSPAYTPTLVVPTNVWTFIALTVDPNGTNATLFMGSPATGIQTSVDDTNVTGSLLVGVTNSIGRVILGRSPYAYWESGVGSYYGGNTMAFNDVTIFKQSLSLTTLTNLYVIGAGIPHPTLKGVSDGLGNLVLTWGYGTLQESTNLLGAFTDVAGPPTSPATVPMTDVQHYYRVRD